MVQYNLDKSNYKETLETINEWNDLDDKVSHFLPFIMRQVMVVGCLLKLE